MINTEIFGGVNFRGFPETGFLGFSRFKLTAKLPTEYPARHLSLRRLAQLQAPNYNGLVSEILLLELHGGLKMAKMIGMRVI